MEATLEDLKLELWLRQRNNDEIFWETKTGDKISIRKMSDTHLKNCINLLDKEEPEGPDIGDYINILEAGDR